MSQDSGSGAPSGPGSGAAKPLTEPPGGPVDRVLNDEPAEPEGTDGDAEGTEDYTGKDEVGQ